MQFLSNTLLVLHFIGLAALLGSFLVQMKPPRSITAGYLHGALLMLVTGLGLVGVSYGLDEPPDNAKIGVKLTVLLVLLGLVLANRRKAEISTGVWGAIGGLAIANVIIAVFW